MRCTVWGFIGLIRPLAIESGVAVSGSVKPEVPVDGLVVEEGGECGIPASFRANRTEVLVFGYVRPS